MTIAFSGLYALRAFIRHPPQSRDEVVEFQNRQLRRLVANAYVGFLTTTA